MEAERRVTGSVQRRVTALATATVLLVLAITGVALVLVQRHVMVSDLDDRLYQRSAELLRAVERGTVPDVLTGQGDDDAGAQVVDADGRVLAATANLRGEPPIASAPSGSARSVTRTIDHVPIEDNRYRVLSRRAGDDVVHVASALDDIDHATHVLIRSLLVAVFLVVVLFGTLIWVLVGRMLARVESAARRERRFVADASHELRTPLTRMRSELEVDLAHPEGADPWATHRSVLEETVALERLVDDLLHLARSDEGALVRRADEVDLDDVVFAQAGHHRDLGQSVDTTGVAAVRVRGDATQLGRAIGNVIDNAVRHGGSAITVGVRADGSSAVVSIADDGPGIPPAVRDRVFERFARGDDARPAGGGAGLGLAIARDIVERHGGTIVIDDASPSGTRVTIRLPLG
jgi:signal transduction histidine kinase